MAEAVQHVLLLFTTVGPCRRAHRKHGAIVLQQLEADALDLAQEEIVRVKEIVREHRLWQSQVPPRYNPATSAALSVQHASEHAIMS